MEQKLVSFKVAKALKEAGYNEPCDMYYHIYDDEYESEMSIEVTGDGSHSFLNNLNHYRCAAPSALDVWLWLWKEKKFFIKIHVIHKEFNFQILEYQEDGWKSYGIVSSQSYHDPEEAIIAAIGCLVDNDLIK